MKVKWRNVAASSGFPARTFVWIVAVLGVAFLGIQFIRSELTNPQVTADVQAPPEVKEILRTSCYNCHSNETRLPWFDRIVPAYWIAARDVRDGRKHLNFSEIGKLPRRSKEPRCSNPSVRLSWAQCRFRRTNACIQHPWSLRNSWPC